MWRYIKRSLWINTVIFILAASAAYGAFGMVRQAVRFWREAEDSRAKIRELTEKKEELERYLEEIRTPQVIEREAKERLNLKMPGEEVVVVPEGQSASPSEGPQGIGERLKRFFQR